MKKINTKKDTKTNIEKDTQNIKDTLDHVNQITNAIIDVSQHQINACQDMANSIKDNLQSRKSNRELTPAYKAHLDALRNIHASTNDPLFNDHINTILKKK